MLPNEIGDMVGLEEIDASDNKLFGLPESIGNLSKLKTFNVSHNQIRCIPPEID
jgi:Leucine-rich repeat (LRR) protein